jgi:hypothetical protein
MRKLFVILLISSLFFSSCSTDQVENLNDVKTTLDENKPELIEITLEKINYNTYDSLPPIDSIEHNQLVLAFDRLKIRKQYDSFEPLKKIKQIDIEKDIQSYLILEFFEAWGSKIHIINYDKDGLPLSGYEIISCGGDGGYSECSKAIIKKNICTITTENTEPLEDYMGHIQTVTTKKYEFDNSLNLILLESVIKTDTIK